VATVKRQSIRRLASYIVTTVAFYLFNSLLGVSEKLGEHAVVVWINDRIAETLGISSPSISKVVEFITAWGPPAVLAALCLSGWLFAFRAREKPLNHLPTGETMSDTETANLPTESNRSPTGGTGIVGARVAVTGSRIEGFTTGLNVADSTIDGTVVLRHQSGGAWLSTDGRFSALSNAALKEVAEKCAEDLRALDREFDNLCRSGEKAYEELSVWCNHEYMSRHADFAYNLTGEILRRAGNIEVEQMSPVLFGGMVISERRLSGMDPLRFASQFLDHVAARLPS
jgi:hypothetical protein